MNFSLETLIDFIPFLFYSLLLCKTAGVWKRIAQKKRLCDAEDSQLCLTVPRLKQERRNTNLLIAVLGLMTLTTLAFMASNAYFLSVFGTTLLSVRVFQMFVVGNCAVYWLVLDLISRDASPEED